MTRTKKSIAVCALALGLFGATASPALALTSGGESSTASDQHAAGADNRHSSSVGGVHTADAVGTENRHSS